MSSFIFSQTDENACRLEQPNAIKLFEVEEITNERFKELIEKFQVNLNKEPNNQGWIINYGAENEISGREKIIRDNIAFRKYDASRITMINGGDAEIPKTQFWIVPPGAELPKPDYYNDNQNDSDNQMIVEPRKLEEFGKVSDRFLNWAITDFFEKLEKDKSLKGYILIHGNQADINEFEARIRNLKLFQKNDSERIVIFRNETSKQPTTSLWIIPQDAELPEELKF